MLREGEVAEQQAAPVTQGNRSRTGQGWIWLLVAGQIRQVLGNTFFHSQCKSFHSWSFLEWSWVWGMATRHQPCGDMSITGDVHEHLAHPCSLRHNLAPTVRRASTKLIPSLLGSAAWKQDGEARVAALFLGSAKHRKCVSTPSASYGRSVPADLATFGFQMQREAVLQSAHFHSLQADAHALMPPKPIQLSLPGLPTESQAPGWTLESQEKKCSSF